eukprot:GHVS01074631.1.p1 GENE.GHVS01074631.1~~GHVS01074631.1.p1  ORF type:complete len:541 (+),score=190.46 GHVS01074631.1:64-1686(+)
MHYQMYICTMPAPSSSYLSPSLFSRTNKALPLPSTLSSSMDYNMPSSSSSSSAYLLSDSSPRKSLLRTSSSSLHRISEQQTCVPANNLRRLHAEDEELATKNWREEVPSSSLQRTTSSSSSRLPPSSSSRVADLSVDSLIDSARQFSCRRSPHSRGHSAAVQLADQGGANSEARCVVHTNERAQFFCLDCNDKAICSECVVKEGLHRGHRVENVTNAYPIIRHQFGVGIDLLMRRSEEMRLLDANLKNKRRLLFRGVEGFGRWVTVSVRSIYSEVGEAQTKIYKEKETNFSTRDNLYKTKIAKVASESEVLTRLLQDLQLHLTNTAATPQQDIDLLAFYARSRPVLRKCSSTSSSASSCPDRLLMPPLASNPLDQFFACSRNLMKGGEEEPHEGGGGEEERKAELADDLFDAAPHLEALRQLSDALSAISLNLHDNSCSFSVYSQQGSPKLSTAGGGTIGGEEEKREEDGREREEDCTDYEFSEGPQAVQQQQHQQQQRQQQRQQQQEHGGGSPVLLTPSGHMMLPPPPPPFPPPSNTQQ